MRKVSIDGYGLILQTDGVYRHECSDKMIGNISRLIGELEGGIDLAEIKGSVAYVDAREIHDILCKAIWHNDWIENFKREVKNDEQSDIPDRGNAG